MPARERLKIGILAGEIPAMPFIENLILSLASEGHEVYLFGKVRKKFQYPKNVRVFATPSGGVRSAFFVLSQSVRLCFLSPKKLRALPRLLSTHGIKKGIQQLAGLLPILSHRPDVLHIQWGKTLQTLPELFDFYQGPVVLSLRGTHIHTSPLIYSDLAEAYRKYFPLIQGFHSVSNSIARVAQQYGAKRESIKTIYSRVHPSLLELQASPYAGGTLQLVSVGRFHWIKGYSYALTAARILKEKGIDFHYTFIAEGKAPEEFIFQLHQERLTGCVSIVNGMPHAQLIEHLLKYHVLLLPSLEEGIANVVLEAMAIGLPVISTECGGMNEVIVDKQNGFLVPVRSAGAMADAIAYFQSVPPEAREKMVLRAKDTIRQKFLMDDLGKEFTLFYQKIVNEKNLVSVDSASGNAALASRFIA